MPNACTHRHPTSGWLSEPAALNPALSKESALSSEPQVPPAHLDGNLPPGPTPGPPPSLPQRPGRGAPPHTLPAGGTTAGLPDLAAPGEAGWVANVMLWHLLCQK